jgi:hypothetical protein
MVGTGLYDRIINDILVCFASFFMGMIRDIEYDLSWQTNPCNSGLS